MANIRCCKCRNEIPERKPTCPYCEEFNAKAFYPSIEQVIFGLIVAGAAIWFLVRSGLLQQTQNEMRTIDNQVAQYVVKQYENLEEFGNAAQLCSQAGLVCTAYFEANDHANYKIWKEIERRDCERARRPERTW